MRAIAFRIRQALRSQWRSSVAMAMVVAVVAGAVLLFAGGARRTATAPHRYVRANPNPADVLVTQERGLPRTDEVAKLPGVASTKAITFLFGGLTNDAGDDVGALIFAGDPEGNGTQVTEGRAADPQKPTEFSATRSLVVANGLKLGDTLKLGVLNQAHADEAGFGSPEPDEIIDGATLVGIVDGRQAGDPSQPSPPIAFFPPSLLDGHDIGTALTLMATDLRDGTDLSTFREQLDSLPDSGALSVAPMEIVSTAVKNAVDAQARGLWVLAGVAALAALAVLGQLVTRAVRLPAAERAGLSSIGFTERQVHLESIGRGAVPVVGGVALAVVFAVVASGVFPSGFVRRIDPTTGMRFDASTLLPGAALLLVLLVGWIAVALASSGVRPARERPSLVLDRVATASPSATASTGLRFAFMRGQRDVGSVRSAVVGLLLTMAGVVGAITFASSLDRLVGDPRRYGYDFDLALGTGATTVSDEMRAGLTDDGDVSGMLLLAESPARVGDATIRLVGLEPVKGDLLPPVTAGRLPAAADEIALGRLASKSLRAGIGDDLTIAGDSGEHTFRVTGIAVVPSIGSNDGVGQDGVLTKAGMQAVNPSEAADTVFVRIAKDAPPDTRARLVDLYAAGVVENTGMETPVVVSNVGRVRAIPYLLALLLGALGVLTVAHVMLTAMRNRRRDVAVLRALGADRGWVTRAVHWQATLFAVLPLVLGVPVGLFVGLLVFRTFADSIGAVDGASFPWVLIAAMVGALVVLANVVAAVPASRARRLAPSRMLQAE